MTVPDAAAMANRLFIAIPIDPVCQQQLDALLLPLQAPLASLRWQTRRNRHLTLAFLGQLPAAQAECVLQAMPLAVAPFELVLTALERFPTANGRIFAATAPASPPLLALQQQVAAVLAQCGIRCEDKGQPFLPHVTLARLPAACRAEVPRLPVRVPLQVQGAHLYVSEQVDGQRVYRVLG